MRTINVGLFAHVDSGKTSIVEQMLYVTKCIDSLGAIKDANTQMDSLEIEKLRGITIKSNLTSFFWNDVKINIVDNPGHVDFIGEVYKSVLIIDIAILVITKDTLVNSYIKMVKSVLKKNNIPFILFINKTDIYPEVKYSIRNLEQSLNLILDVTYCQSSKYYHKWFDIKEYQKQIHELFESDNIQRLMNNHELSYLVEGSARTGYGIEDLLDIITSLATEVFAKGSPTSFDHASAVVFRIEFINTVQVVYMRVLQGVLMKKFPVYNNRSNAFNKIQNIHIYENNRQIPVDAIACHEIGCFQISGDIHVGDIVGGDCEVRPLLSSLPTYQIMISPVTCSIQHLANVMDRYIVEDPYLSYQSSGADLIVSLYGKTQLSVLQQRLQYEENIEIVVEDIDIEVKYKVSKAITCIYRFNQAPYYLPAALKLLIEPSDNPRVSYSSLISYGYLVSSFQKAVEDGIHRGLKNDFNEKEVIGIHVTLVNAYFDSVTSTPAAFRSAAEQLIYDTIKVAHIVEMIPYVKFILETTIDKLSDVLEDLSQYNPEIFRENFTPVNCQIYGRIEFKYAINYQAKVIELTSGNGYFDYGELEYFEKS